jgi:hypothetical protein
VARTRLQCKVELKDGLLVVVLKGALVASDLAALEKVSRARDRNSSVHKVLADLTALDRADSIGVEALRKQLGRFRSASALLPAPWALASHLVRAHLGEHVLLAERMSDLSSAPATKGVHVRGRSRLLDVEFPEPLPGISLRNRGRR